MTVRCPSGHLSAVCIFVPVRTGCRHVGACRDPEWPTRAAAPGRRAPVSIVPGHVSGGLGQGTSHLAFLIWTFKIISVQLLLLNNLIFFITKLCIHTGTWIFLILLLHFELKHTQVIALVMPMDATRNVDTAGSLACFHAVPNWSCPNVDRRCCHRVN